MHTPLETAREEEPPEPHAKPAPMRHAAPPRAPHRVYIQRPANLATFSRSLQPLAQLSGECLQLGAPARAKQQLGTVTASDALQRCRCGSEHLYPWAGLACELMTYPI